jgi:hypothetical protein
VCNGLGWCVVWYAGWLCGNGVLCEVWLHFVVFFFKKTRLFKPHLPYTHSSPAGYVLVSCALSRCIFCHLDLHALITQHGLALPNLIPHCLSALPLALKIASI